MTRVIIFHNRNSMNDNKTVAGGTTHATSSGGDKTAAGGNSTQPLFRRRLSSLHMHPLRWDPLRHPYRFFIVKNGHRYDVREPFPLAAFFLVKNGSSHEARGPFPFPAHAFPLPFRGTGLAQISSYMCSAFWLKPREMFQQLTHMSAGAFVRRFCALGTGSSTRRLGPAAPRRGVPHLTAPLHRSGVASNSMSSVIIVTTSRVVAVTWQDQRFLRQERPGSGVASCT